MAADATMGQSIMVFNRTTDKIWALDSHKLCGASGVAADRGNFLEYVEKNMKLIELENGYKIDMPACSSYVRNEVSFYFLPFYFLLLAFYFYYILLVIYLFINYIYCMGGIGKRIIAGDWNISLSCVSKFI